MIDFFTGLYVLAAVGLMVISLNCYVMVYMYLRRTKKAEAKRQELWRKWEDSGKELPKVTTQLPIFNEYNVAESVILKTCEIEYPKGLHEIQVLDDSTDDTVEIVAKLVKRLQGEGHNIVHIHRKNRQGFKAGALAEAMDATDSEYFAIFDADFLPPKDFLLKTVPYFLADEKIGLVQARWGHINRNASLLTRIQSLGIDGHFAIEQSARDWNDLYLNFNGTAGIWRRQPINEAGGWSWDTLTEDMDLSYRMQFAGWKTQYLIDLECPAEVPEDINAFKSQQFRWAKGSTQTAMKILPMVWKDKQAGLFKKFQAFMHVTHYFVHPLMLSLALLALPLQLFGDFSFLGVDLNWLYAAILLSSAAPSFLYTVAQKRLYPGIWWKRYWEFPALICIGTGLALNNTRAVFEALLGKESGFVRTPKKGATNKVKYAVKLPVIPFIELSIGLYCLYSLTVYVDQQKYMVGPFMSFYTIGFLFVGTLSLIHSGFMKELGKAVISPFGLCSAACVGFCVAGGAVQSLRTDLNLFYLFYLGAGLAGFGMYLSYPKKENSSHIFIIFAMALLCRLVLMEHPASDDIHRYIWEGKIQNLGYNPYELAPDDASLVQYRDTNWQGINHKDWPAIYAPAAQIYLKGVTYFSETIQFMKGSFILFDMIAALFLWGILRLKSLPSKNLILYLFNPVILMAFAGQAHIDILMICLTCATLFFFVRGNWFWCFAALGLAASTKYTAFLILPFLLKKENVLYAFVTVAAFILPFYAFESSAAEIMRSLFRFGSELRFNDSVHALLHGIFKDIPLTSKLVLTALVMYCGFIFMTHQAGFRACFLVTGAFLILSPTVHHWYFAWIVPFLVLYPNKAWLLLCMTSVVYYNVMTRADFGHSLRDSLIEYVPFYLLLAWSFFRFTKARKSKSYDEKSVSVIVPVWNEEKNIPTMLKQLHEQTQKPLEIIAVDGASTDKSFELLKKESDVTLLRSERGRGNQIARGLEEASGDVVFIMHADMGLEKDVLSKISRVLSADQYLVGGCVGARFNSPLFKYRVIRFLNVLRVKLGGISFGDQGQFFLREKALEEGWFPKQPLMEDIELALRMHSSGKTTILDGGIIASTRRWENKKVSDNAWHVIRLLAEYLVLRKFKGEANTEKMYESYYERKRA